MEKEIPVRIKHKHGTFQEWNEINPKIYLGELIIYDPDESYPNQRIKIGDGVNTVEVLPFLSPYIKAGDNIFIDYDYDGAARISTGMTSTLNEINISSDTTLTLEENTIYNISLENAILTLDTTQVTGNYGTHICLNFIGDGGIAFSADSEFVMDSIAPLAGQYWEISVFRNKAIARYIMG